MGIYFRGSICSRTLGNWYNRDTTGVYRAAFERILQQCSRATLAGKRDYVLLRLLWGNALRRNEISQLSVCDFDPAGKTVRILGKGRGTQAETIDLGSATVQAIADWLEENGDVRKVQKLSRHRNLNTLMIYDDNRGRDQQDVTEMLDGMF